MNKTFLFLSLSKTVLNSPFLALNSNTEKVSLKFSEFRQLSHYFLYSKNLNRNFISIQRSKFYDFLTNSIRIENNYSKSPKIIQDRAVYSEEYQLEITETIFGRNKNQMFNVDGGALYVETSTIHISKCQFIDNFVTSSGGAIRIERCLNSTISDCLFARNEAEYVGGAAVLSFVFDTQLTDSNFTKNYCNNEAASIAFLMCDRVNPVTCIDYASNTGSLSCAWLFNSGEFEIGVCFYCCMNNSAIKTTLYAGGSIFSTTFQKILSPAILWASPFTGTIQECIFDGSNYSAIRIIKYYNRIHSEPPTIDQCSFNLSLTNSEIEKQIVDVKYSFDKNIIQNNEGIVKKKKKYAETYINIQQVPCEDTFNNYNSSNLIPFIISFVFSLTLLQLFNYWLRTKEYHGSNAEYTSLNQASNAPVNDIGVLQDYERQQFEENIRYDSAKPLNNLKDIPLSNI